jgi:hypothetical protein
MTSGFAGSRTNCPTRRNATVATNQTAKPTPKKIRTGADEMDGNCSLRSVFDVNAMSII